MNMQIQNTNNMKFGRKQDFLSELGKVWGKVDEIEKKAQKIWGEDNNGLMLLSFRSFRRTRSPKTIRSGKGA